MIPVRTEVTATSRPREVSVTVLLVRGAYILTRVLAVRQQFYPALFSVLSAVVKNVKADRSIKKLGVIMIS
jgi:hypothetical protein